MTDPDINLDQVEQIKEIISNASTKKKVSKYSPLTKMTAQALARIEGVTHDEIASVLKVGRSTVTEWANVCVLEDGVFDLSDDVIKQLASKHAIRASTALDHMTPQKFADAKLDKLAYVGSTSTQSLINLKQNLSTDNNTTERTRREVIDVRSTRQVTTDEAETLTQRIERLKQ